MTAPLSPREQALRSEVMDLIAQTHGVFQWSDIEDDDVAALIMEAAKQIVLAAYATAVTP